MKKSLGELLNDCFTESNVCDGRDEWIEQVAKLFIKKLHKLEKKKKKV